MKIPNDFYTFLIISKKKSSAKKMTISSSLLKGLFLCLMVMLLFVMYTFYDYIKIKREEMELARLRQQTKEQKIQIEGLAEKVNNFAIKMDELRQLDKQIRVLANVDDKHNRGQILGIGGSPDLENRVMSRVEADQKMLIANINRNVDQLTEDSNDQGRSYHELIRFLKEQKSIREATPSLWPVRGWVTSEFGNRPSPLGGDREFHKGIDISARMGIQIVVPADGIVLEASYDREMGHMIRINHGHGVVTWYGHLMKSAVREGSLVKRGAVIGYIGNSGRSTGSHLHYSVFLNGVPVNPRKYLN
jgi:murein DD-endopeptidase MepM/ murein hydrolase activator NlpD